MSKARPVVAPPWIFFSSPYAPAGVWIRTDLSVAQVACEYCESKVWEPCRSKLPGKALGQYTGSTHAARRKAATKAGQVVPRLTLALQTHEGPPEGCNISLSLPLNLGGAE